MEIRYLDGVKFEAESRGHKVVCDQPEANGGRDEGMTPPEFLLASLGTCAAYYAVQYLKTRSLPTEGFRVTVSASKATEPARLGSFRIELTVPEMETTRLASLERAVRSCLVQNTLIHSPSIEIAISCLPASGIPTEKTPGLA